MKNKNILVIHPKDYTTDFLSVVYDAMECSVIRKADVSKKYLKEQIKSHEIIIMLGHGCKDGLFGKNRLLIDSQFVYLLRDKICHCIWCNANEFVEKYKLKGNFSGMIISEIDEALMFSIKVLYGELNQSNFMFAAALRKNILGDNFVENMLKSYIGKNAVYDFNRANLFSNITE